MMLRVETKVVLAMMLVACGADDPVTFPVSATPPEIVSVVAPDEWLVGTEIHLSLRRPPASGEVVLTIAREFPADAGPSVSVELSGEVLETGTIRAVVGRDEHRALAALEGSAEIRADVLGLDSAPFPIDVRLADELAIGLDGVTPSAGEVYSNDVLALEGYGMLAPSEGVLELEFDGTFTPEGRPDVMQSIRTRVPVSLGEPGVRERGGALVSSRIGNGQSGRFLGTVGLIANVADFPEQRSELQDVDFTIARVRIDAISPARIHFEDRLIIEGRGFLGREADESTQIRLAGTFTRPGGSPVPVEDVLFLRWVSGQRTEWELAAEARDGALVSGYFGVATGVFEGTVTPEVFAAGEPVTGAEMDARFELAGMRQVVWLNFLPGFYAVLPRFGLSAAAGGPVETAIAERIRAIYHGYGVEVRLTRPEDVSENGYTTIEIGGRDPNGEGLLGYENTVGKDVGNLRLYDVVGGASVGGGSSEGYGGVFVESMLAFSENPGIDTGRFGPPAEPLFDEIFDPVRRDAASAAEIAGSGDRAALVARALRAFANMVGETAAHELGHALGLAVASGNVGQFHNPGDGGGCLMDAGSGRPLGERLGEPGFPATRLCEESREYLDALLAEAP